MIKELFNVLLSIPHVHMGMQTHAHVWAYIQPIYTLPHIHLCMYKRVKIREYIICVPFEI